MAGRWCPEPHPDDGPCTERRHLPNPARRFRIAIGQFQLELASAAKHLQDLHRYRIRIIDVDLGRQCGVERRSQSDQRMDAERTFDGTALDHVLADTERGVDLKSGNNDLRVSGQEDNVERCVGHRLNYLQMK